MKAVQAENVRLAYWSPLAVLVLLVLTCGGSCQNRTPSRVSPAQNNLTTNTKSTQFSTDQAKIQFLSRYLVPMSSITAAEFDVSFHDNSGGAFPGPSDWNIRSAVKISPKDVGKWAAGFEPSKTKPSLDWGTSLLPTTSRWKTTSTPKIYTRNNGGTVRVIFEREGIVFTKVVSESSERQ